MIRVRLTEIILFKGIDLWVLSPLLDMLFPRYSTWVEDVLEIQVVLAITVVAYWIWNWGWAYFLLVNFLRDVIFLNWLVLKFRYLLRLRMGYFLLFDLGGPEIQIHGIVILRVTHLPAFVWGVAILDLLLHQLLLYLLILLLLSELLLKLFEYLILLKLPSLFDNKITLKRWQVWANL